MKIAILTSGILPVPAVRGGAVENLIDFYLDYNDKHKLHDITVFSVYAETVEAHPALRSDANHYVFIDTSSIMARIKKKIYGIFHPQGYYHYSIEYYLKEAIKLLKKTPFDMVIIENRPGFSLHLQGMDISIALHLHNDILNEHTPHHREIYSTANKIISVSGYITQRVQTIGDSASKCLTVYNGIHTGDFSPERQFHLQRSDIGLNDNDFVLLFSGRLAPEKGISELIEAMKKLSTLPNIKLLIIGSSFFGNAKEESAFARTLRESAESIKDRIIFTGFVPYKAMPAYLSIADVAVIPSVWNDPFPTTVLEAQAMALPIVTTNRGGIPEEVGKNAIILPVGENFVEELSTSILDLYKHPDLVHEMRLESKSRSKLFTKEKFAENFFKAITQ